MLLSNCRVRQLRCTRKGKQQMRPILLVGIIVFSVSSLAQQAPTFTVEAESAFVWGQDSPNGAFSSAIQDPLTGSPMHKLTYHGVEVGSRLGYEAQWGPGFKTSATPLRSHHQRNYCSQQHGLSCSGRVRWREYRRASHCTYRRQDLKGDTATGQQKV